MLAFLSNRWVLAGLGVLAVAAAVAVYLSRVYRAGEEAGAAAVTEQVQTNTITIQRSIQRAEQSGPRTPRDVSKRLRDGTF